VASGGKVALLNVKGQAENYTRGDIDNLTEFVADFGAKGLAWMKVKGDELTGPIVKFLSDEELSGIKAEANAEDGDLLLFVAVISMVVFRSLDFLRVKLGEDLDVIDHSLYIFLWVVDWPLVEYDEDAKRYTAAHHPFTSPQAEDLAKLLTDLEYVKANDSDI